MQSKITKQPKSAVKINVSVTASDMAEYFKKALDHLRDKVHLEGFRKGKAPDNLIVQQIGRATVEVESLEIAINQTYIEAAASHKILPINDPEVKIKKFEVNDWKEGNEGIVLEYEAQTDVLPEVEIKDYKSLKIKKDLEALKVKPGEIDEVLKHLQKERAKAEPSEKAIKESDLAVIDFEGSLDKVKRDELSSKNYPVVIGDNQLIPGFEKELIGLNKGDEKTFKLRFPKDYIKADLRNKEAEFTVKVLETQTRLLPEIDEEFAKSLGVKDLAELKDSITKSLEQEHERIVKDKEDNQIIEELISKTKVDLPEGLINQERDRIINDAKEHFQRINLNWNQYLSEIKKTEEGIEKEATVQAEKNVKIGLIFGKIMKEEGLDPHEKEANRQLMEKLRGYSNL